MAFLAAGTRGALDGEHPHDNFRFEVCNREKTHFETKTQSLDAVVSQAAWHATSRPQPGVLLTQYDSCHAMEKTTSPRKVEVPPQTIIDGNIHADWTWRSATFAVGTRCDRAGGPCHIPEGKPASLI